MNKHIVTLTGPSCSGKSTLARMLVGEGFGELVSTTTRTPRDGEVEGKDYYFVAKSTFKRLQAQGAFVETVEFAGNCYGVSVKEVERVFAQGKPVVIVVEPDGAAQIRRWAEANGVHCIAVFVGNKLETLLERMVSRIASDKQTPAATYATRIRNLIENELRWRWQGQWDIAAPEFKPGATQEALIAEILKRIGATRVQRKRKKAA